MKKLLILLVLMIPNYLIATPCGLHTGYLNSDDFTSCCRTIDDSIHFTTQVYGNNCTVGSVYYDFGDGTNAVGTGLTIAHLYTSPGTYVAKAFPLDLGGNNFIIIPGGNIAEFWTYVTVQARGDCECGILDFNYTYIVCENPVTRFEINLILPNCDMYSSTSFLWDFNDPNSGALNNSTSPYPDHIFTQPGTYQVTLTVIVPNPFGVLCTLTVTKPVIAQGSLPFFIGPSTLGIVNTTTYVNVPVSVTFNENPVYFMFGNLDFGDNTTITGWNFATVQHTYTVPGYYTIVLTLGIPYPYAGGDGCITQFSYLVHVVPEPGSLPCTDCIGSFNPEPGKKYLVSAWVREDQAGPLVTNFTSPSLRLSFADTSIMHTLTTLGDFYPAGDIIDGWQRIEQEFTVPSDAATINIKMNCVTGDCLFDDIRVFPFDGTMKSYVYDPISLKLAAELDERNYATLYEYDEEGKLIRVKKETERGVMTIKESRNHLSNK